MSHNRLSKEKSPYLLQHQHNPIHWYAWSNEAFAAAQSENKIIFLSIGYSSCYWCHMMEKDSFEHQVVADALNPHFISIKVDREEHPDVDQIYMDAVQGLTGRGGWPLTVFLTPDLKPFFGGTYFRQDQFLSVLEQIQKVWQNEPLRITQTAQKITEALQSQTPGAEDLEFSVKDFLPIIEQFSRNFDSFYGGFSHAPKFPQATQLSFLLRMHSHFPNSEALKMADVTLTEMAKGGLYDHVGGGFHRYSTDERWFVPHFEKMLYDNALLVLSYAQAASVTGKSEYADIVKETLDFVLQDMTNSQGGFYAALDAGDVDEEGDYYVWQYSELQNHFTTDEWQSLKSTFGFTESGNWEHGKNIVYLPKDQSFANQKLQNHLLKKLFEMRQGRERPRLDTKILTSWTGLMIAAFASGYRLLKDVRYLHAAQKAAQFVQDKLQSFSSDTLEGLFLNRRYCEGESKYLGTLDDYSYLIYGLLQLQQADLGSNWYDWIQKLQTQQDVLFWDDQHGGYFFTPENQTDMIVRKKDSYDGAQPSGNAITAWNLLQLHNVTQNESWLLKAQKTLQYLKPTIDKHPLGATQGLLALDYFLSQSKTVVVIIPDQLEIDQTIKDVMFATATQKAQWICYRNSDAKRLEMAQQKSCIDNQVTFYVCENGMCFEPTTSVSRLLLFLG